MAEYYGTVILPARIRKPQDKAAVENSVKIASQRILGKLRNHPFHCFLELQEAVAKTLEKINSAPLTGKNMSRWDAFLAEEKNYLLTLPKEDFELSEWTVAKVQPNSHIAYQNHFYSVPFEHLGETVDVRATQNTVEIFYHHQRIASHKRVWGSKQYSTVQDHMPPGKMFLWIGMLTVLFAGPNKSDLLVRKLFNAFWIRPLWNNRPTAPVLESRSQRQIFSQTSVNGLFSVYLK